MVSDQRHFGGRRHVQARETDDGDASPNRSARRVAITAACSSRMREWSATSCEFAKRARLARTVASSSQWAAMGKRRFAKDLFQGLLVVDQQVTRAGADKDLDARRPLGALQFGQIVGRRSDVEAEIDQRLAGRQLQLFVQSLDRRRRRIRVGHFQKRRDAALGTGARGRRQIFFVRQTGFTKMHLIVNDTRQQVLAAGVDHLVDVEL